MECGNENSELVKLDGSVILGVEEYQAKSILESIKNPMLSPSRSGKSIPRWACKKSAPSMFRLVKCKGSREHGMTVTGDFNDMGRSVIQTEFLNRLKLS